MPIFDDRIRALGGLPTGDIWLQCFDGSEAGIDVTGWKLTLTLKSALADADLDAALQTASTAGEQAGDDPGGGLMHLPIDLSGLSVGRYYYDLQREYAGAKETLEIGKIDIIDEVTQA